MSRCVVYLVDGQPMGVSELISFRFQYALYQGCINKGGTYQMVSLHKESSQNVIQNLCLFNYLHPWSQCVLFLKCIKLQTSTPINRQISNVKVKAELKNIPMDIKFLKNNFYFFFGSLPLGALTLGKLENRNYYKLQLEI